MQCSIFSSNISFQFKRYDHFRIDFWIKDNPIIFLSSYFKTPLLLVLRIRKFNFEYLLKWAYAYRIHAKQDASRDFITFTVVEWLRSFHTTGIQIFCESLNHCIIQNKSLNILRMLLWLKSHSPPVQSWIRKIKSMLCAIATLEKLISWF